VQRLIPAVLVGLAILLALIVVVAAGVLLGVIPYK